MSKQAREIEAIKEYADCLATAVLQRAKWSGSTSVDPFSIATNEGIEARRESIASPFTGSIQRDENANWIMSVNKDASFQRQRFTCGFLLSWFVRREDFCHSFYVMAEPKKLKSSSDIFADAFSVSLLMPKVMVEDLLTQNSRMNVQELASVFDLTPHMTVVRLKALGYKLSN